jgi:hypothetical protein
MAPIKGIYKKHSLTHGDKAMTAENGVKDTITEEDIAAVRREMWGDFGEREL